MLRSYRSTSLIFVTLCCAAACSEAPPAKTDAQVMGTDPVISRALNDPLMIDPDLAWINEANAAIGYHGSHALPSFTPDERAEALARDAARIELREEGSIEELPVAESLKDGESLTGLSTLREIVETVGAPDECVEGASDDLAWAARMPISASIMPHGMVQQAAGSDTGSCKLRIVRYVTQADAQDALQYHFTRATNAKLETSYKSGKSALIKGEKAGEKMFADVDDAPSGLRVVTLVHWTR